VRAGRRRKGNYAGRDHAGEEAVLFHFPPWELKLLALRELSPLPRLSDVQRSVNYYSLGSGEALKMRFV
jgi:hypothetical protein